MKTPATANLKDNIAAAILLAAMFIAIVGAIVTSSNAHADKAAQMELQTIDAIVITAPRHEQVVVMDAIVVTASRDTNTALASK